MRRIRLPSAVLRPLILSAAVPASLLLPLVSAHCGSSRGGAAGATDDGGGEASSGAGGSSSGGSSGGQVGSSGTSGGSSSGVASSSGTPFGDGGMVTVPGTYTKVAVYETAKP